MVGQSWKADEGLRLLAPVATIDPLHTMASLARDYLPIFGGAYARAERALRDNLRATPHFLTRWCLALALAYQGQREEACAMFAAAAAEDPAILARRGTVMRDGLVGDRQSARRILRSDLDVSAPAHRDFAVALWVADCHAIVGDTEDALEWVERSVALGMINYSFLNGDDPVLAPIRAEPRFQQLMGRVKQAGEAFEV